MTNFNTKPLLISLSIIACILLAMFVYSVFEIGSKNAEAALLHSEADMAAVNDTIAQSIRASRNAAKEHLEELSDVILTDEKLIPFIELLEVTGQEIGLNTEIASVSAEDSNESARYSKVRVTVETKGGWAESIRFIHALENLPYHTEIMESSVILSDSSEGNIELTDSNRNTTGASGTVWSTSTSLIVYVFKKI